ncbi:MULTISPECIES: heme biosynthesis HemY N-terminal domain-containing protein, partial [Vibrio]
MIRLIFLFVVLGAGLFVGTQFSGQQGYVLISIANKTIEMSVTTLVIFVIAALAGLFLLEYLIKKLVYASSSTWNYFSVRKMRRSRRYTNEGIIKLLEGDWKGAEKKVTRWANHHDMPLLCYLVASEAAQGQGDK